MKCSSKKLTLSSALFSIQCAHSVSRAEYGVFTVTLSAIVTIIVMLTVIMLNANRLSVVAPKKEQMK
jgi:hypothetical protein